MNPIDPIYILVGSLTKIGGLCGQKCIVSAHQKKNFQQFPTSSCRRKLPDFLWKQIPAAAETGGSKWYFFFPKPSALDLRELIVSIFWRPPGCHWPPGWPITCLRCLFKGDPQLNLHFSHHPGWEVHNVNVANHTDVRELRKAAEGKDTGPFDPWLQLLNSRLLGGILLLPSGPVSPIASRSFQRSVSFLDLLKVILDPFYDGKRSLNYHLGIFFSLFASIFTANLSLVIALAPDQSIFIHGPFKLLTPWRH